MFYQTHVFKEEGIGPDWGFVYVSGVLFVNNFWNLFIRAYISISNPGLLISGPSILRPLTGPEKCVHILQVVLK